MVEYINSYSHQLDLMFQALSDQTRREILVLLKSSSMRVTDLAAKFDLSLNAVSKHLKVLERSGLLRRTVTGRTHHCRVDVEKLKEVEKWIQTYTQFWNSSLDSLEDYLKNKGEEK